MCRNWSPYRRGHLAVGVRPAGRRKDGELSLLLQVFGRSIGLGAAGRAFESKVPPVTDGWYRTSPGGAHREEPRALVASGPNYRDLVDIADHGRILSERCRSLEWDRPFD